MEEILASIRRIISEDDAPADKGDATPPAATEEAAAEAAPALAVVQPEPEPEPEPQPAAMEEDVLELTEVAAQDDDDDGLLLEDPAPVHAIGDIEVAAPPPTRRAAPAPAPAPAAAIFGDDDDGGLVSAPAANEASLAFGQLVRTVMLPAEGHTLEDVVREMLRPMLKDWLDRHLPEIVEAQVRAEVERIARRR